MRPPSQRAVSTRPWWVNYGAAVLIQVALTALLLALYPYFELGRFPAPYAVALLVTILVFGDGPAIVALVLSVLAFNYYFVPPTHAWAWPNSADAWASEVAYVLLTSMIVIAVGVIQRGKQRAERLAESLLERTHTLDLAQVFVRDMGDVIVFWNRGSEMLYGFTADEAVGRVSHDLLRTVFLMPLEQINEELFRDGEWTGELVHTKRDGTAINVATQWTLHRDENGDPIAIIEANNDISGRVRAQRAMEKALQELAIANQDLDVMNEELQTGNEELMTQIHQRTEAEEKVSNLAAIVQSSGDAIIGKNLDGVITSWNSGAEVMYGYSASEVIGQPISLLIPPDRPDDTRDTLARVSRGEAIPHMETERVRQDGRRIYVALTISPVRNASGEIIGASTIARDITDQKRADQEREMTIEFLRLMNVNTTTSDMVRAAATFFQKQSGCEAVGIRLREGDDYPYYEARGFSDEFIAAENSLCTRDDKGCIARDRDGYPICECMCGNIVQGRFDASLPFFTEHGSFWTNGTSELLATTTEENMQARSRDRCNGEGHESVALMPLHVGEERLGLLQLNDRRRGMFSPEAIGLWERFADYLAVALAKLAAEEGLAKSEQRMATFAKATSEGIVFSKQGRILDCNDQFATMLGYSAAELEGVSISDLIAPDDRERSTEGIRLEQEFTVEHEMVRKDGGRVIAEAEGTPMPGTGGQRLSVVRDITERRRAENALREAEASKRDFYRLTILAATEGKLVIAEREEIGLLSGALLGKWKIEGLQDVGVVRSEAISAAREAGMDESRVYDFMACVVESAGNAAKHAKTGEAALYRQDGKLLFVVSDSGSGISAMSLPDVALTKGYTTAGTLGMGYKVMVNFADKVYLATGSEGTTVALEMALHADSNQLSPFLAASVR